MQTHFFPVNPNSVPTCAECGLLGDCGGLEGDAYSKGCFQRCDQHCRLRGCDVACPSVVSRFIQLFEDVGGICTHPTNSLRELNSGSLPLYIPQVNHRSSRQNALDAEWISLPLYAVANRDRRGRYDVRFESAKQLRSHFRLAPNSKIIITSVTPDRFIEDFWAEHVIRNIPEKLARLDLSGITAPNYSFMLDVPRTNSLYNLSRIFRAGERLSEAGLPTAMHINASTPADWNRWHDFLAEQSHIQCVAVEFQTGTRRREVGNRFFDRLVQLRDRLGRNLHPVAMAGASRIRQLSEHFPDFTIVDSMPFMKTLHRRMYRWNGRRWKWRKEPSEPGEMLDHRLAHNIVHYTDTLCEIANRPRWRNQLKFKLGRDEGHSIS